MRTFHAAAALAALASSSVPADVVNLAPSRDATLVEDTGGESGSGSSEYLFAGRIVFGQQRRALLRFDAASLPQGAEITSVSLRLRMTKTTSGETNFSLHRVTADWSEGPSGGSGRGEPAQNGDATWEFSAFPGTSWASPGGDFSATASASATVDDLGVYTWGPSPQMLADVQAWIADPAANFGWVLKSDDANENTSAKRFASRENPAAADRPVLTITYSVPCRADFDHNGTVEPADIATFVNAWLTSLSGGGNAGDFDGNGSIEPADIAVFVNAWLAALSGFC